MLDRKQYEQVKWIIARSELVDPKKRGAFSYQKPKSSSTIDLHHRVSGLQLGLRAVQTNEMVNWLQDIKMDLLDVNQMEHDFDYELLPDIGLRYQEFTMTPLGTTIHTALEFINMHKDRIPVIFKNDFWCYKEIIDNEISDLQNLQSNHLLIISVPFFKDFKQRKDMDQVLDRCCELGVPVMLDLIWLPLTNQIIHMQNTDCVEVITHSMTKLLPMGGIKGGLCFWKSPAQKRHTTYPLGGNVGFYITKKYFKDFNYYHVRDSLANLNKKWCDILQVKQSDFVLAAEIPKGHVLEDQSLHAHTIPESKLLSLLPFYENDRSITHYLQDQGLLD